MSLKTPGDLVLRLQKMEKAVSPAAQRSRLIEIGVKLKPVGPAAAAGDLGGDAAFSGWPKAEALEAAFKLHTSGAGLTMHRTGRTAGPWRVAESGRHPMIGPFKPNITKTGKLAKKQKTHSKYSGSTDGFGSWTKATVAMAAKAAPLMRKAQNQAVLDAFRGK